MTDKEQGMTDEKELVAKARAGDRAAVEELVRMSKDAVYGVAIRMLGDPADAEDMVQEIFIRAVTGLATFRGDSSFRTWVYRIAVNHLLTARKRRAEETTESFAGLAEYLDGGIAADLPPLDDQVLVNEAKLTCTSRMVLCLDRDHRLAFVLGEILELSSEEGAEVLEITTEAFRKRLSRARERMEGFTTTRCGLVDPSLPCRCSKQAARAAASGRLNRNSLRWATHPAARSDAARTLEEVSELERGIAIFRSHPEYSAPESIVEAVKHLLATEPRG